MEKSSIDGPLSMAMLNNQRVTQAVTQACQIAVGYWKSQRRKGCYSNNPLNQLNWSMPRNSLPVGCSTRLIDSITSIHQVWLWLFTYCSMMTGSTDGSWQSVQAARSNFPLYHLMLCWYSLKEFMLAKCSSWILIASKKSIFSHGLLTRTPRVTTPAMYQRLLFHLFYWLLVPISVSDFKLQRSIWDALMRIQVKLVGIQAKQSVLSGWWYTYPSEKIWVRQLGLWHSQYFLGKSCHPVMATSHHQPDHYHIPMVVGL